MITENLFFDIVLLTMADRKFFRQIDFYLKEREKK